MNSCFTYLVGSHDKYVFDLTKNLKLLKKNYLNEYPTDVVVFYRKNIKHITKDISDEVGLPIIWKEIEFRIPEHIDKNRIINIDIDYLHMIQFFCYEMWNILENDYDYACRLDTDSFITGKINYNLFETMKKNNYTYVFNNDTIRENDKYLVNLYEHVGKYIISHPCNKRLEDINNGRLYYANFEIAKTIFFCRNPYFSFYLYLDMAGGIYYNRWSDCVIKYIGVNLLLKESEIGYFDIPYNHQEHHSKREK